MPIVRKVFVAHEGGVQEGRTVSFRYGPSQGIALMRGGILKAYVNRCTHMGGPVELKGDKMTCRWHQADFHPDTGEAIQGQAPQGTRLTPIELVHEEGDIFAMLILPDDPFA